MWQQLRREDPVHWTEGRVRPFWSITRHDDIVAAFIEPNLFTSSVVVPSSPEVEQITPEMSGAGQMMIMTDPPLHGAMRRAFNRLLLPRAVGVYDDPGRKLVAEILDAVRDRGSCDFVVDVAARLPHSWREWKTPSMTVAAFTTRNCKAFEVVAAVLFATVAGCA